MKKFYKELLEELISSGELSPVSREKVWERFERLYGKETGKRKRLELELNSLKKTQESWNAYTPVSKELLNRQKMCWTLFCMRSGKKSKSRPINFMKPSMQNNRKMKIFIYAI